MDFGDDQSGLDQNPNEDASVSAMDRTSDMDLNKTDVIAKMAFPSQLDADESQHQIASAFEDSMTIDLQSKHSAYRGLSTHSKLSKALKSTPGIAKNSPIDKSDISGNFINLVKEIN